MPAWRGSLGRSVGCFDGSPVTPVSIPGAMRNRLRWPMGRLGLSLRWSFLTAIAARLSRFWRAGGPDPDKAHAHARPAPLGPTLEVLRPPVEESGDKGLIGYLGHLCRSFGRTRGELGHTLPSGFRRDRRRLGIRTDAGEFACRA
jgi:hypothetical protein